MNNRLSLCKIKWRREKNNDWNVWLKRGVDAGYLQSAVHPLGRLSPWVTLYRSTDADDLADKEPRVCTAEHHNARGSFLEFVQKLTETNGLLWSLACSSGAFCIYGVPLFNYGDRRWVAVPRTYFRWILSMQLCAFLYTDYNVNKHCCISIECFCSCPNPFIPLGVWWCPQFAQGCTKEWTRGP